MPCSTQGHREELRRCCLCKHSKLGWSEEPCYTCFTKSSSSNYNPLFRAKLKKKPQSTKGSNMKLFIWTDFQTDYTPGLAFAIAKDEAEAKRIIIKDRGCDVYNGWGDLEVRRVDWRVGRSVSGGG